MGEILLCNRPFSAQLAESHCGVSLDQLSDLSCSKPKVLASHTPYLVGNNPGTTDQQILRQLFPKPVAQELTNLALSLGGDNVLALAEIRHKFKDYNIGLMGASTSMYANRIGGFAGAVREYQRALMEYRQGVVSKSPMKSALKKKAHTAFHKMQIQFRNELRIATAQTKSRRGTPLTSADRATNIAESSRSVAKLEVTNQIQATNLVKFASHAKFFGTGLVLIDFTSRVGNVHNSYLSEGNWERDLFIESASFGTSAVAGAVAVKLGASALGLLMVATPVGWVGLVFGGLAVAGTAAATSIGVNQYVKKNVGATYDQIMKWLQ